MENILVPNGQQLTQDQVNQGMARDLKLDILHQLEGVQVGEAIVDTLESITDSAPKLLDDNLDDKSSRSRQKHPITL